MTDDLIYCPKCNKEMHFENVEKSVRIFELSQNDTERIHVVQCELCKYPIGVYKDPIYPDDQE